MILGLNITLGSINKSCIGEDSSMKADDEIDVEGWVSMPNLRPDHEQPAGIEEVSGKSNDTFRSSLDICFEYPVTSSAFVPITMVFHCKYMMTSYYPFKPTFG